MATETDWAWLAGLIDGEGCLMYARKQDQRGYLGYSAVLNITMCTPEALEKAAALLGGKVRSYPNGNTKCGTKSEVKVNGAKVQEALVRLLPHLTTKATQACLLLEALAACPPGRGGGFGCGKAISPETRALQEGYHLILKAAKPCNQLPAVT